MPSDAAPDWLMILRVMLFQLYRGVVPGRNLCETDSKRPRAWLKSQPHCAGCWANNKQVQSHLKEPQSSSGPCTVLKWYLCTESFSQITFFPMHICKGMAAKKTKIEGISNFWFFAIFIKYITRNCQGGRESSHWSLDSSELIHSFFFPEIQHSLWVEENLKCHASQWLAVDVGASVSVLLSCINRYRKIEKVPNKKPFSEDGAAEPAHFRKIVS